MEDFSRQPTKAECLLGIVLTAALSILFGSLSAFLALRNAWVAAIACAALFAAAIVMLYRAVFGKPRALGRNNARMLAWVLLFMGIAGFAFVLLLPGSRSHRLMVLGGAAALFSSGLAGVKGRGHDA